jgi:hypothetical protein
MFVHSLFTASLKPYYSSRLIDLSDKEPKLSNVTFGLISSKTNIKPDCNKGAGVNRELRTNTELN